MDPSLEDLTEYSVGDCVFAILGTYMDVPVKEPRYVDVLPAAVLYQIVLTSGQPEMAVLMYGGHSWLHTDDHGWRVLCGMMPQSTFERALSRLVQRDLVVHDRREFNGLDHLFIRLTELGRTGYQNGYAWAKTLELPGA